MEPRLIQIFRNVLLAWLWLCAAGIAGEVSLRDTAIVDHAVVRLGDVAELYDVPADQRAALLDLELLPAPPSGAAKTVGIREIQETLARRAPEFARWTFSGASSVSLSRPAVRPERIEEPKVARPVTVSRVAGEKSKAIVEEAILGYVRERLGDDAWQIDVELNEAQLATLANDKPLQVTGGRYLDDERVQFRVEVGEGDARETWKLDAQVTLPPMMLVAARNLERGEILTEHDVTLVRAVAKRGAVEPLRSVEDAVGKEIMRSVAKGQAISAPALRAMLMVKRGQVVTVYSRCGGVQIRTTGRAMEDGGLGDLVPVESIGEKETFHARVSAHQEVEIVASSPSTPVLDAAPREATPWLADRRRDAEERPAPRRNVLRTSDKERTP